MKPIPRLAQWILGVAIFFLLTMTILRFFSWVYFKPAQLAVSGAMPVFFLGFRYDARMVGILSLLLFLTALIPPLNPFRKKAGKVVALSLAFIFIMVLVVMYSFDFLHFKYLQQRLNASALSYLEDAKISGSMVWQTYPVIRILLAMIIAAVILYFLVSRMLKAIQRRPVSESRRNRLIAFPILFSFIALAIFGKAGQYPLRWSDAFNLSGDFQANIALNPIQSFFSSLSFRSSGYDEKKVKEYYPLMADYLGLPAVPAEEISFRREIRVSDSSATKPNIILVICESFSGYKSSMWGNPLNATPFFNQISKEGIFFDNCFTPHFGTARGVWATITGIPDVELQKTASRNPGMVDQHTIINDFKGYEKLYFLGGSTSWANIRGLLTNNIRELRLYEEGSYKSATVDVWGISDKNLFLEANEILKTEKKPFFAIIQTADNHRPYTIPEEDLSSFKKVQHSSDELKKYGYESNEELNAFRYTDFGYQTFIEAASKETYFSNTIFMFIGDHGINGNAGNMFPASWTDQGLSGYHVPLLFYAPGRLKPQRLHDVASQVDVLPTLAGLAGISYTNTTLGRDLLHRHASDSGKSNKAFIIDYNYNSIGIIKSPWYFSRLQQGNKNNMVWADFSGKPTGEASTSDIDSLRLQADAFYQTARYMLLKNRKQPQP
ncbi:MAG: LTA synthase family protein [Gemmatimonadaceae bacterium]|nr:LTA synthase family protein [Chitinophagaceae bacterium]